MGALSAAAKWVPEDDFLLKNAVEAGASLEALAKGAVCFSRRFTLRELQDRWYSLLYDSETSAEASARIVEYEIELSASNPSKANKISNIKGKDFLSHKRKVDSVRSHYYAMRKRICNEPCNSTDLGFVVAPCSCIAAGRECICGGLLKAAQGHHLVQNVSTRTHILDCYGNPDGSYSSRQHVFPEMPSVDAAASLGINVHHPFRGKHMGMVQNEGKDGIDNACLYNYSHVDQLYEHDYIQKNPQLGEENIVSLKSCPDFQHNMQFQQLAVGNQYGNEVIESKPLVSPDQDGVKHERYTGNNDMRLQDSSSSGAIDQHACSSAPGVPIWSTMQDVNVPNMLHIKEKEQEILTLSDDKKMDTINCDAFTMGANLNGGTSDSGLYNPTMISENDIVDFPSPFEDFSNILLDDPSYLNSPHETNQDDAGDSKATEVMEMSSAVPNLVPSKDTNMCCNQVHSDHHKHNTTDVSGINLPSALSEVSYPAANVECMLNTEDPDIPSNDDVVLPDPAHVEHMNTIWDRMFEQSIRSNPPAATPLSNAGNSNVGDLTMVKQEHTENIQPSSHPMKPNSSTLQQKEGVMSLNNGCILGAKSSEGPSVGGALVHDTTTANNQNSCTPVTFTLSSTDDVIFGKKSPCGGQHENFDKSRDLSMGKPTLVSDHINYNPLNMPGGCKPEIGTEVALQNSAPSRAMSDMEVQNPVVTVSNSDQEEQISDDENDVPHFSDIEAMILEMDLIPCDQEPGFFSSEVSRFQYPDSKKAIIRLEQGAQSYMNRAILSRGAFAVFYGRHLKYFIKDPEVSLGRETEDVKVDIDLGKEGRANKISRRQAIIKMDEGGSFHIKNTGKCSIFVNSKEVPSKKRINLSSGSLIEIRDMRFIFEVNQNAVRRYICTLRGSSQSQNTRFDWAP